MLIILLYILYYFYVSVLFIRCNSLSFLLFISGFILGVIFILSLIYIYLSVIVFFGVIWDFVFFIHVFSIVCIMSFLRTIM